MQPETTRIASFKGTSKTGDLVIAHNEPSPRFPKYPFAVINEVKKGTDGHVRLVTLRITDGWCKERDIT